MKGWCIERRAAEGVAIIWRATYPLVQRSQHMDMTQLLLLGKFEYTGGPIFKVVLEC